MSDKKFIGIIAALVVVFIGAIFIFGGEESSSGFIGDPMQVQTGEGSETPVQPADHFKGDPSAAVTFIEYADFECPACAGFHSVVKQIEEVYGDQIVMVFRHFPLSTIHPNAVAAHRAAEAAGQQGKFWEMHDLLYENQQVWARQASGADISAAKDVFENYAEQLGLNIDQFNADSDSPAVLDYISSHQDSGNQLGITGTPTVYINGEEISARSFEEISSIIDEILAESAPAEDSAESTN